MTIDVATTIANAVRAASAARDGLAVAAALNCIEPGELAEFFHVSLAGDADTDPIGEGLPASPGAATGRIVLTADEAMIAGDDGDRVILVRPETTPDDVLGMQASQGILTMRGGMVSHAAVVARGWGIPAVVGAADVHISGTTVTIGATVLQAGDVITIDGSTGRIYTGELETSDSDAPPELDILLNWADAVARGHVQVRANADTEGDATHGRALGAQGIGLCRTEHMFLAADRLPIMRRFILSNDPATEAAALTELEAAQTADFETVLEAMDTLPVTIRLLDPPLHEFLPDLLELTAREATGRLSDEEVVEFAAARRLHEANPMIGTRGVRLGAIRPGVYQMQVRALCLAAAALFARGKQPHVEIMIPLVVDAEELRIARSWVRDVLDEIGHPELKSTVVTVGAMIETPRAALVAGELAKHADFFSFGTNDLTQMTFAFSRDDVESKLLPAYQALGILPANPFEVLDQEGVGELVRIASAAARATKPGIKLGACGEHAGHPASADFLVRLGLDSVSCSPFRVPMARLGVAQALLACGRVHINDVVFDFEPTGDGEPRSTDSAAGDEAGDDQTGDMGDITIDEALVLHTLRVRGFVTPSGFADSLGDHPADILSRLVDDGLVRHIEKRDMYGLLPPGKERQEALLDEYAGAEVQAGLASGYEHFLELNEEFKQLCTEWQMRDGNPNDHSDTAYDQECIGKLGALASAAEPVVDAMASALPRLARYNERLAAAADCVARGEINKFTGVMCESFHDIWMELHEDLIVLQRIDRVAEGSF
ncbi:MAG TPA: putative PEP-binding protein [Ilumatobacter sp.]|nr:putative PEP-binding protein [Ilumatobacter sp.]